MLDAVRVDSNVSQRHWRVAVIGFDTINRQTAWVSFATRYLWQQSGFGQGLERAFYNINASTGEAIGDCCHHEWFEVGSIGFVNATAIESALLRVAAGTTQEGRGRGVENFIGPYDFIFEYISEEGGFHRRIRETADYLGIPVFAGFQVWDWEWAQFTREGLRPYAFATAFDQTLSMVDVLRFGQTNGLQTSAFIAEYPLPRFAYMVLQSEIEAKSLGLTVIGPSRDWCLAYAFMTTSCQLKVVDGAEQCICGRESDLAQIRFGEVAEVGTVGNFFEYAPDLMDTDIVGPIHPSSTDGAYQMWAVGLVQYAMECFKDMQATAGGRPGEQAAPDVFGNLAYRFREVYLGLIYFEHDTPPVGSVPWGHLDIHAGWLDTELRMNSGRWYNSSRFNQTIGRGTYWEFGLWTDEDGVDQVPAAGTWAANGVANEHAARVVYMGQYFQDLSWPDPVFIDTAFIVNFWKNTWVRNPNRFFPPSELAPFAPWGALAVAMNSGLLPKNVDTANGEVPLMHRTVQERRDLIASAIPGIFEFTSWGLMKFNRYGVNTGRRMVAWQTQEEIRDGVVSLSDFTVLPEQQKQEVLRLGYPTWDARFQCLPGYYTTGMQCLPCRAGAKATQLSIGWIVEGNEDSVCEACPAGRGTSAAGMTECVLCDPGTFQDVILTNGLCTPCQAGRFQGSSGSTSCAQCPAGLYSEGGATACSKCPAGNFSEAPGSSACPSCRLGTFSFAIGQTACEQCGPGRFGAQTGMTQCTACETFLSGAITTRLGARSRHECLCPNGHLDPRGYAADPSEVANQQISCERCPKGLECVGQVKLLCPVGSDAPTCECGIVTTADGSEIRDCVDAVTGEQIGCPNGVFCNQDVAEDAADQAFCPFSRLSNEALFGVCTFSRSCMWALNFCNDDSGAQLNPVYAAQDRLLPGYWAEVRSASYSDTDIVVASKNYSQRMATSPHVDAFDIWMCESDYACPGQAAPESNPCESQHKGLNCGECASDQVRYGSYRDRCKTCDGAKYIVFPIVFIAAVVIAVICSSISLQRMDEKNLVEIRLAFYAAVSFCQYVALMSRFNIHFPHEVKALMTVCEPFLLDFTNLYQACIFTDSAFGHVACSLGAPVALALLAALLSKLATRGNSTSSYGSGSIAAARNLMGMIWLLFFPGIATTTMSMVECYESPNGGKALRMHPSVRCPPTLSDMSEEAYSEFGGLVVLFSVSLMFLVVGLTAAVWVQALTIGRWIGSSAARSSLNFIIFRVRTHAWWFEPLQLSMWLLLSLAFPFAVDHGYTQMLLFALFAMAMLVVQQCQLPFTESIGNMLNTTILTFLLVLIISGMWFPFNSDGDNMANLLKVWFIVVIVFVFGVCLFLALRYMISEDRQSRLQTDANDRIDVIRSAIAVLRAADDGQIKALFAHAGYIEMWHLDNVIEIVRNSIKGSLVEEAAVATEHQRTASVSALGAPGPTDDAEVWV